MITHGYDVWIAVAKRQIEEARAAAQQGDDKSRPFAALSRRYRLGSWLVRLGMRMMGSERRLPRVEARSLASSRTG